MALLTHKRRRCEGVYQTRNGPVPCSFGALRGYMEGRAMHEVEGYERRLDRDGQAVYIHTRTGRLFFSELVALRDFHKRVCFYANSKMSGHDIHNVLHVLRAPE